MLSPTEVLDVLVKVRFQIPGTGAYQFTVETIADNAGFHRGFLLHARYDEEDIDTRELEEQTTRKWYISKHATVSEVVQTCLKCVLTSMEHRVREHFTYNGKRVFNPHINVEAHAAVCDNLDVRN